MGRCDKSLPSGTPPMAPSVVVTQLMASLDQRTPARSSTTTVGEATSVSAAIGAASGDAAVGRPSVSTPLEVRL